MHCSSSSSGAEISPAKKGKKGEMRVSPPYKKTHPSLLRVPGFLSSHTTPLKRRGNRHQQSGMGGTVGAPIRLKHNVPGLIMVPGR